MSYAPADAVRTRELVLSRSWGLTPKDAERIAIGLGIMGIRFVTLGRRAPQTPSTATARKVDRRGARFLRRGSLEGEYGCEASKTQRGPRS